MKTPALSLLRPAVFGLAAAALLSACNIGAPAQEDPTRYYLLSDVSALSSTTATSPAGARIGLHAIVVEGYLKKREMIVRTGDNEVDFKDFRRWAEPLDAAIGRVLRASLVAAPGVANVASEPFPIDQDRDYDVAVEVRHCEGVAAPGGFAASFAATIEIWTAGNTAAPGGPEDLCRAGRALGRGQLRPPGEPPERGHRGPGPGDRRGPAPKG